MRYLSQIFQPVNTIPKNAVVKNTDITCKSQKLLLECGLIRPSSSGLFTVLPLARRALNKLEALVRRCVERYGAQQVSLPALCAAQLWERSGRLQDSPAELLTVEDRHGKKYLLAPTHEESIADLLGDVGPLSYKQLPLLLYQISSKYRDEHRPKHGLLRAREFTMLDAYGVHADQRCANNTYQHISRAYVDIFNTLSVPVHRVDAPAGSMGGGVSHEWQLVARAGEDSLELCARCTHSALHNHTHTACPNCGGKMDIVPSVEVGHTFILGSKYSEPLAANVSHSSGDTAPLLMTCYGIGITRLLAAALEHLSTDRALRWPEVIAPYSTIIIGPKEGSKEWSVGAEMVHAAYNVLRDRQTDALIDDRHHLTIGKRMMMADRMGYPNIIVIGRSALETPSKCEVYRVGETNPRLLTLEELAHVTALQQQQDVRTDTDEYKINT